MSNSRLSVLYTFLALLALLSGTSTLAQEPLTPSPTAHKTPRKSGSADQQMSTGVLAVQVDGRTAICLSTASTSSLFRRATWMTLKLTVGQHFVDLRDEKGAYSGEDR